MTREQWSAQPGCENVLLLLAFYLGAMVAQEGRTPLHWCTAAEARARLPNGADLPDASWSRVVGLMRDSACVPLGVLEDRLFGESPQMTCRQYVERLAASSLRPADENERCTRLMDAVDRGQAPEGGLAFLDVLGSLSLDRSVASLERLDALLRRIRQELRPQYDTFVNRADTQNFLRWAAFYTGMATAAAGGLSIKWLSHAELARAIDGLEFQFETTSGCVLDGRVFFPLGLVTEILLQPDPQRTLHGWARERLSSASPPPVSIRRISSTDETPGDISGIWEKALRQAGFFSAFGMFMVEGGSALSPQVLVPTADGGSTIVNFGLPGQITQESLQAADQRLETNPENVAWQVMAFDGYANLSSGRTDAITIDMRCYGGGALSGRKPLEFKVVCPYRPASHERGFAIYSPKLLGCSAPKALLPILLRHFYVGIYSFKMDPSKSTFAWNKYLDESV
jgi:hypothetical protein